MELRPSVAFMNKFAGLTSVLLATTLFEAGAADLFVNDAPFASPPQVAPNIDARAWLNRAPFGITNFLSFQPVPFESQNTLFFTNIAGPAGLVQGDPGYRFQYNRGTQRFWMDTWENRGSVLTDHQSFFAGLGLLVSDSLASVLYVAATNITSTGPLLTSGAHGLIKLEGRRVNLARNALRTGSSPTLSIFGGGFSLSRSSNYVNDLGITDLYWGWGTNNSMRSGGGAMPINGTTFRPNFNLPTPTSPIHDVVAPSFLGRFFTNSTAIPGAFVVGTNLVGLNQFTTGWAAVANTNQTSPTSSVVQVVFYPTNSADGESVTDVRFDNSFGFGGDGAVVTVQFRSSEFDIATQTPSSNAVYLVDTLGASTNIFFARNSGVNTRRPVTYEVTRFDPGTFAFGLPGNTPFRPDLLFNASSTRSAVTNIYAAYAAQVDLLSSSPSGSIPYQSTNLPGRIEIIADQLNLDHTRIRAESAVIIRANNLVSNSLAQVDAPIVSFDARSTQPVFLITNLAPPTVKRFGGSLRAYSTTWVNEEAVAFGTTVVTNQVTVHVLIVDSQLQAIRPVSVFEFGARGTNIVLGDQLNIGRSFVVEGNSLHLTGGLSLPSGSGLGASNLLNVLNFTNDGIISLTGSEQFGTDRSVPYSNYVNHGTNRAASHLIRTANFENTGCLAAEGGLLSLDALNITLMGNALIETNFLVTNIFFDFTAGTTSPLRTNVISVTNQLSAPPKIQGLAEVEIRARDFTASNSLISAGGLILSVTNSLRDTGSNGVNRWNVSGGFSTTRLPTTSDLAYTWMSSFSPAFGQVDHTWAGLDLGALPDGYTNNLAIGKLILDGGQECLFRFFAARPAGNAIYVDYLELDNFATNYNESIACDENFSIYFANANLPATKLDGAAGGRLHWVQGYTGPLSSTNLTYYFTNGAVVTSNVYTFNLALVTAPDLDSDGDGIVNRDDPTPIYVAQNAVLAASIVPNPRGIQLQWNALGYSSNFVEFTGAGVRNGNWQILTNFLHGPYTSPVQVFDPVTPNGSNRVYRLRVDRGPYYN